MWNIFEILNIIKVSVFSALFLSVVVNLARRLHWSSLLVCPKLALSVAWRGVDLHLTGWLRDFLTNFQFGLDWNYSAAKTHSLLANWACNNFQIHAPNCLSSFCALQCYRLRTRYPKTYSNPTTHQILTLLQLTSQMGSTARPGFGKDSPIS